MTDDRTERLDDLMDQLVFELLDEKLAQRVREKIETDPTWQLAYEAAVQRKRTLSAAVAPRGATSSPLSGAVSPGTGQTWLRQTPPQTTAPAPKGSASAVVILAAARVERTRQQRRIAKWSFGGVTAAAAVLIAFMSVRAAFLSPPSTVLRLLGQTELASGSIASVRALVAELGGQPKAGAMVTFVLRGLPSGQELILGRFASDSGGLASGSIRVPDIEGSAKLAAYTDDSSFSQVESPIRIQRACKVYLATDKPIYQPGQTIHMRCLALRKAAPEPDSGGAVEFTVTDPAGNIVFKQSPALSEYGLAWADLPLDDLVSPGRYAVKVAAGADTSEQTVEVFHYKLPAFAVKLSLDKPYYLPGQTVSGKLDVQYHFGKPVAGGKVELELVDRAVATAHTLKKLSLVTDAEGQAGFEAQLPETLFGSRRTHEQAELLLTAHVVDSASQENVGYLRVPVAWEDIRIAVVAENGLAERGRAGRLYVVTSYPDGRPAKTTLDIETLAQSMPTNEAGAAAVEFSNLPAKVTIRARDGRGKSGTIDFVPSAARGEGLILRSDRPVYTAGGTMNLEVRADKAGEVFVDIVKDRQTVLTKAIAVENYKGTLAVDLPAELSGTLTLHAYRLGDEGEWVGRDLLIVVRPAGQLKVNVASDKGDYRPGADARLTFDVTDPSGKPVAAALSLAAVDEAVYSVQQAAPGLEGLLAGLEEQLLTPAIEAHGFSPGLMERDETYASAVLAAAVPPPAAPAPRPAGEVDRLIQTGSIDKGFLDRLRSMDKGRVEEILEQQPQFREELGPALLRELFGIGAEGKNIDLNNRYSAARAFRIGKENAKNQADLALLIGGPVALATLIGLMVFYHFTAVRPPLALRAPVRPSGFVTFFVIVAIIVIAASLLMPGLGRARELARRSSDVAEISALVKAKAIEESDAPRGGLKAPRGAGAAPVASVAPALFARDDAKKKDKDIERLKSESGAEPARTRTYFPETMLWRPQIITDGQGKAELSIPLADSITTWRLAGSAVSKAGLLGKVESNIRVFQPFFVDINAPLTLTQGDEVSVPVVLYNYAKEDLEVSLKAAAGGGLSLVNAAEPSVTVAPGEVKRRFIRVKAEAAGTASLTIDASAGGVADSIRRDIAIVPPGHRESLAVSGGITDGRQIIEIPIPSDAVPGSLHLQFKVYPSTFSELLDGLDNIFQMPSGCFEQTSSTTYPNVMALSYMKAHGLDKPEIAAKATNYIQLGYQRLLSFEIKGGGFDWFGRPPANAVLTAYGMMEFADMAKVHSVDAAVLRRTADWLASRQDGEGAWHFESGCFHEPFTGADSSDLAVTAYVTWALAGYDPASAAARRGGRYIAQLAPQAKSPRTIALCACALLTLDKDSADGLALLRRLSALAAPGEKDNQKRWGDSPAGDDQPGITRRGGSGGRGGYDDVATTATVVLAMSHNAEFSPPAADGMRWIAAHKDARGTWGTTQATVLALKALLAGSGAPVRRSEAATIVLYPGNGPRADMMELARLVVGAERSDIVHALRVPIDQGQGSPHGPERAPSPALALNGSTLRIALDPKQASGMGYQFSLTYHTLADRATNKGPLDIQVHYDRTQLTAGQTVNVDAVVSNRGRDAARMLLADIGTPPGFSVDPAGLDKLRDEGKIDRYTPTARGVIVYIGTLAPSGELRLRYAITARMPLKAVAAPTSVYAYYQPQQSASAAATRFEVK